MKAKERQPVVTGLTGHREIVRKHLADCLVRLRKQSIALKAEFNTEQAEEVRKAYHTIELYVIANAQDDAQFKKPA